MKKKPTFALLFTIIVSAIALYGVFKEGPYPPVDSPWRTFAGVGAEYTEQGKVIVCYYDMQAVEERSDTSYIIIPNQLPQMIVSKDRYWQDKPFRQPLPGKVRPEDDQLLTTIPVQEDGGRVVAIASVRKVPKSCKVYDFQQKNKQ